MNFVISSNLEISVVKVKFILFLWGGARLAGVIVSIVGNGWLEMQL